MKKFKNGLVLGKFMPPQVGHLFLIDVAAMQCETLHVMMCSDSKQPIPGELRYSWLKEIYRNTYNVNIIWCRDENPQYPHECESVDVFYNNYWVPSVYRLVKELDVVFTSEEYGEEFASYLGIKHVMVNQPRDTYAICATEIRKHAIANWHYIPNVVKPYFKKKIAVIGPESTGKSTLVKLLARHYNTNYVEEYGRTYCETVKDAKLFTVEDFNTIGVSHSIMVNEAFNRVEKLLFVDTEAIVTRVFGEMYIDGFKSDVLDDLISKQTYDLYLLTSVDIPWVDDGTRDFPNARLEHYNTLKAELESRNLKYVEISGSYQERFMKAIDEINKL